jgi:ribonuclease M5
MKKRIKEVIVVEGKDDISAVKIAVDAEMIEVNGFAVRRKSTLEKIKNAAERVGVIILTDPDFAGEKIRTTIENYVPNVKHAYISREEGRKGDNIGIENANPEAILKALEGAKSKIVEERNEFTMTDMIENGLSVGANSKMNRQELGSILKIGYANTKQFLSKLNNFGITREEFQVGVKKILKK